MKCEHCPLYKQIEKAASPISFDELVAHCQKCKNPDNPSHSGCSFVSIDSANELLDGLHLDADFAFSLFTGSRHLRAPHSHIDETDRPSQLTPLAQDAEEAVREAIYRFAQLPDADINGDLANLIAPNLSTVSNKAREAITKLIDELMRMKSDDRLLLHDLLLYGRDFDFLSFAAKVGLGSRQAAHARLKAAVARHPFIGAIYLNGYSRRLWN